MKPVAALSVEASGMAAQRSRAGWHSGKSGECGDYPPPQSADYFLTAAVTVPVWDWGTLRSKLHQAEYKQQSAKAALSLATRTDLSELYATYDEALVARAGAEKREYGETLLTRRACVSRRRGAIRGCSRDRRGRRGNHSGDGAECLCRRPGALSHALVTLNIYGEVFRR